MPIKTSLSEEIIREMINTAALGPRELTKDDDFGLPRLLPAANGGAIQITKGIDDRISALASELKAERPQLNKNVRNEEWRGWVRSAIGPLLSQAKLSAPIEQLVAEFLTLLNSQVHELISSLGPAEYSFGTTFLKVVGLTPFSIGPVTFEPRDLWLTRKLSDGTITATMHRRIARAWNGAKPRPRRRNIDNMREQDIMDAIGGCPFVCSVKVDGLSSEAGREIALSAARLGLACVSLIWTQPSQALRGMNLRIDGGLRSERILRFVPGKIVLQGSRLRGMPHGPSITSSDWSKVLSDEMEFFSAAGEVLSYFASSDGNVARPNLMNTLTQSLLWFHEGCRESNDLLAIVDFAASLDALGGGKKAKAILAVLEARLGVKADDAIYKGGPPLKSVIDTIYSDGRSRAVHGTSDKIGHDWTRTRSHAEALARLALFASLNWVGANPGAKDDPSLLKGQRRS